MKQGFLPSSVAGGPIVVLSLSIDLTSSSYVFSDSYESGTCVQVFICAKAFLGAGVTGLDLKLQQSFSFDSADWFDYPLVDVANKFDLNNEFICPTAPYVISIVDSNIKVGPIAFPLLAPFYRLAYKISGVGTANAGIILGRTIL